MPVDSRIQPPLLEPKVNEVVRAVSAKPIGQRARGRCLTRLAVLTLMLTGGRATPARAGDWPQILGPTRAGIAVDEHLPAQLTGTLKPRWTHPLGQGYAGPAVVGQRVYVFHRLDEQEVLEALDAATGQSIWRAEFAADYRGGIDSDTGPRCVPLVAQDTIVVHGAAGAVHAVRAADGQRLWSRDLLRDLGGSEGYFGAGSAPIVVGNRVLINTGGRQRAGIVALELKSGKTVWQATDEAASYSSPIALSADADARVLFITRLHAVLIDSRSGDVLGRRPFGDRGATVNAATPVLCGQHAFITASYGIGAALVQLDSPQLEPIWANDDALSSQYNTPVFQAGHLFGIHGREDVGNAELRCIEAQTGRVRWTQPEFGVAHLIAVGDRLLALKVDGTLVLLHATPEKYTELGRAKLSSQTTRAMPALSNGRVFVRENKGDAGQLICVEL